MTILMTKSSFERSLIFSIDEFKKICALICLLQFLLAPYSRAEDDSLLVSYGSVNQITRNEQLEKIV